MHGKKSESGGECPTNSLFFMISIRLIIQTARFYTIWTLCP